jgi:hypothetical protein
MCEYWIASPDTIFLDFQKALLFENLKKWCRARNDGKFAEQIFR